jgi:putative flippase GtrA
MVIRPMIRVQELLAPGSGPLGQWVRFVLTGCLVALVYLLVTTLAFMAGVPFEVALPIGFCLAIMVHFTLHRGFVWANSDGYALSLHRQASRYLPVVGMQYGVTAASTSLLPHALGLPTETVFLATAVLIAAANFLIFRRGVFHSKS